MDIKNNVAFFSQNDVKKIVRTSMFEWVNKEVQDYIEKRKDELDYTSIKDCRKHLNDFESLCEQFKEMSCPDGAEDFFMKNPQVSCIVIFSGDTKGEKAFIIWKKQNVW
jgi:hypothetical protein